MNSFFKKKVSGIEKKTGKGRIFKGAAVLLGAVCFFGLLQEVTCQPVKVSRTDTAMGTVVTESLYVTEKESTAPEEVLERIRALEEDTLSYRLETSEVYRINQAAEHSEALVQVSEKLKGWLEAALAVSEKSSGALDITLGSLTKLWGIDKAASGMEEAVIPSEAQILEALSLCGYEKLSLSEDRLLVPAGLQLDLGAVGKGAALSEIAGLLKEKEEVSGAVISVGGSVLTYGSKPDGESFRVAVANPEDAGGRIGYLELTGQWCISTSGDYERFAEAGGKRYHHILDPDTGRPADSGVRSVTILTKDGLLSDALSTACFVLGTKQGLALAEEFDAEALVVDNAGKLHMTEGMEAFWHGEE